MVGSHKNRNKFAKFAKKNVCLHTSHQRELFVERKFVGRFGTCAFLPKSFFNNSSMKTPLIKFRSHKLLGHV